MATPGPGGTPAAPPHDDPAAFYVVQSGDTLSTIAQKLLGSATKAGELMRLNNLADADAIYIGQVLRLR